MRFAGLGRDQVRLSAWFKDNTALSTSLFDRPPAGSPTTTRPGRLRLDDGGVAQDRVYASIGATLDRGRWEVSAVWGLRNTQGGATSPRNRLYTASAGYTFTNGIGLRVGVARQYQNGSNLDTVGGLVTYGYSF